jgi:hypothetical protein
VLLRDKIEVFLRNLQTSVSGHDIGVLDILVVKHAEFPVGILGTFRVLELGNLAEDGDLLNQTLQSTNVD